MSFSQYVTAFWAVASLYVLCVLADTEARNFNIYVMHPPSQTLPWKYTPLTLGQGYIGDVEVSDAPTVACKADSLGTCPHETWFALALPPSKGAYTFRLSWPGSSAAAFTIDMVSSADLNMTTAPQLSTTRVGTMYARVIGRGTSVRTPSIFGDHNQATPSTRSVRIHVLVETLHFGIIPHTLLPTLIILAAAITVAYLYLVPPVTRYLERVANAANADVKRKGDNQ